MAPTGAVSVSPRTVTIEGKRIDPLALLVHSILIFANTFLVTLPATALAGHPSATTALWVATFTAALKVVNYLAARTGTPIDGTEAKTR